MIFNGARSSGVNFGTWKIKLLGPDKLGWNDLIAAFWNFVEWVLSHVLKHAFQTNSNELWHGRVTAARHTSAEWYLFGGCNVLVVTTFKTGLLLFPLHFIVITRTWWVRQHLLCLSDPMAMARAQELQEWVGNGKWSWWCHTHFCNGRFTC
jgi:hypothetical protein